VVSEEDLLGFDAAGFMRDEVNEGIKTPLPDGLTRFGTLTRFFLSGVSALDLLLNV
jgi:hypothetical protein